MAQARRALTLLASLRPAPVAVRRVAAISVVRRGSPAVPRAPHHRAFSDAAGGGARDGGVEPTIEQIEIDPNMAGSVIGSKGVVAQRISRESGAYVQVETGGGKAVVKISGTDEARGKAKLLIDEIVNKAGGNAEQIEIDPNMAGFVIGSKGVVVQRISSESGANVQVDSSMGKATVSLRGSSEQISHAKSLVEKVIADAISNMPLRESVKVTRAQAGMLIGKGGARVKQLEQESGCTIRFPPQSESEDEDALREMQLTGPEEAVKKARALVEELLAADARAEPPQRSEPGTGRSRPRGEREEIMVPTSAVSALIGKGGSNIRKLTEDSGAQVMVQQVDRYSEEPRPPETRVVIQGDAESRDLAKALIDNIVSNSEAGKWWGEGESREEGGDELAEDAMSRAWPQADDKKRPPRNVGGRRQQRGSGEMRGRRRDDSDFGRGGRGGIMDDQDGEESEMFVSDLHLCARIEPLIDEPAFVDVDKIVAKLNSEGLEVSEETQVTAREFADVLALNGQMALGAKKMFLQKYMRAMTKKLHDVHLEEQEE